MTDQHKTTSLTATAAPFERPLTVDTVRGWNAMLRENRRTNVTVVVVDGHTGPPTHSVHPTDGTFIECGYPAAKALHETVPLRLVKVISPDRAHFEVALPFGIFTPLFPPPYEVPPQ